MEEDNYRNIIQQINCFDNINDIDDLMEYIQENNLEEINNDMNSLDLQNMFNLDCSFTIGELFLPTPSGTNFFSIYNPFQATNAIIPDLFRLCIIKEPILYQNDTESIKISPKIKISDSTLSSTSSFIVTRYQKLLPLNIIKSFFYFGYSSNFEIFDPNNISFLEIKIKSYIEKASSSNSKFTDPITIFNELYSTDSLLQNMIQLNNLLETVKQEKSDLTNTGNYNLPYLFTYYIISQVIVKGKLLNKKYSNFRDKNTTSLSYSDLVYLNYLKKLITDNLIFDNFAELISNSRLGFELDQTSINKLNNVVNFTKNNNIFILIDAAFEVKQYILNVISYNLNNKKYNIENYAKPTYLAITKKLYCNYANNESYNYPELSVPDTCL